MATTNRTLNSAVHATCVRSLRRDVRSTCRLRSILSRSLATTKMPGQGEGGVERRRGSSCLRSCCVHRRDSSFLSVAHSHPHRHSQRCYLTSYYQRPSRVHPDKRSTVSNNDHGKNTNYNTNNNYQNSCDDDVEESGRTRRLKRPNETTETNRTI